MRDGQRSSPATTLKAGDAIGTPIFDQLPKLKLTPQAGDVIGTPIEIRSNLEPKIQSRSHASKLRRPLFLFMFVVMSIVSVKLHGEYADSQNPRDDSQVVESLRAINAGQAIYQERHDNYHYGTLEELILAGYIAPHFGSREWQGYRYEFGLAANRQQGYWVKISPIEPRKGEYFYFINESSRIRTSTTDFTVDKVNCTPGKGFSAKARGP